MLPFHISPATHGQNRSVAVLWHCCCRCESACPMFFCLADRPTCLVLTVTRHTFHLLKPTDLNVRWAASFKTQLSLHAFLRVRLLLLWHRVELLLCRTFRGTGGGHSLARGVGFSYPALATCARHMLKFVRFCRLLTLPRLVHLSALGQRWSALRYGLVEDSLVLLRPTAHGQRTSRSSLCACQAWSQ